MTEGVVRNGLWYPDDRDWVEVKGTGVPPEVKGAECGWWSFITRAERQYKTGPGTKAARSNADDYAEWFWGEIVAVLDLRPKPRPRKDHGPSADTQARDWCHQQWTEAERDLRKANAYIRELEAENASLKEENEAMGARLMWSNDL